MTGAGRPAVVLLAMLATPAPAQDESGLNRDEQHIRALRMRSNDAIQRHDVEAIVSFLDDEYQVTTSVGTMSQGVDMETESLEDLFASRPDAIYVRRPDAVEISRSNPLASESGTWEGSWTSIEGPVKTGGSYMAMWRKVDARWKIRSELFVALWCEGDACP